MQPGACQPVTGRTVPGRPDPSGNSLALFGIDTDMSGIETLTGLFEKPMVRDDGSCRERFAAG
jgi:hypothetical protein